MPMIYSPVEVAEILGLHVNTVWRWLASGKLPGRKVGGIWLVSARRLSEWVDAAAVDDLSPPAPGGPAPVRAAAADAVPRPARRSPPRSPARRPASSPDDRWVVPPIVGH